MFPPDTASDRSLLPSIEADQETAKPKGATTPEGAKHPAPDTSLPSVPGYEILEVLGGGSMGIVYKARQLGLQRFVALKRMLDNAQDGKETLQRFVIEARAVASLQHPNIVQIYEINLEHTFPYFSMEYVAGGTLADKLGGRPQPVRAAAQLILILARAVQVAHQSGIVHRDLKPANILLAAAETLLSPVQRMAQELEIHPPDLCLGTPKITDFGLAKELFSDASQTESGVIMGTPSYMAPEQAEGKSREVGPTADIYALGAILYEMLTGRPPFTAESPVETILLLFQAEPVSPTRLQPRLPRDLETICLKCLHKDPQRRYASADALAEDLQRFLSGEPILARPASWIEELGKWMRRQPVLATLTACVALAVVSLVGLGLWHKIDLESQLGQALENERETRSAQEASSERARLEHLRERLQELLQAAANSLATRDWQQAQVQLARARAQVADEPELAALRTRLEQLQQQTHHQRRDQERLQKFSQQRNEALFHATLFTGSDLASARKDTRTAALEALSLFDITLGSATKPTFDSPNYTKRQQAEIVAACYELLVVLADVTAQPFGEPSDAAARTRAKEALRILEATTHLSVTTQAFHYRRAQYLAQAQQSHAALQERQRAETLRPLTPLDHFLLGQERYGQGHCVQAAAAFENVLQLQPDHFWASYYLALCRLKTQRADQAAACLTACLGQRRDLPWLYLLRASAWGELGQFERAEADFANALKTQLPETARYGLLINRGVLRIRQDRLESARADLQQAIALRPQQYQGYLNLAQAYLKSRQTKLALQQLDEAIRLEPKLASLYRTRSRLHLLAHNHPAALADLECAIGLETNKNLAVLTEDHLERGRLLQLRKDFTGVLACCEVILGLRPSEVRAFRLRAEALLELKRLPEALQALDNCLKYGSPDAGVFRARAALRMRLGQYAGAQTDYTRALELDPDAATHAARGWCYLVADAPRLALPDFDEAIRLAPKQGDAFAGRGYIRILAGDYPQALADADEALRHGPPTPRLLYNVARIYAQAVALWESEGGRTSKAGRSHRSFCQDRALQLLTHALDLQSADEAAQFWQQVIHADRAFHALRRSPGYSLLAARYALKQTQTMAATKVQPK